MNDGARVLSVVEDEVDIRTLIRVTLSRDGSFSLIDGAGTAEEAIESAREHQPSVVILDHSLDGEMTGVDAAPRIKEVSPRSKILLFTAYSHLQGEAEINPAIDDYLLKTNFDQLLDKVKALLTD